MCSSLVFRQLNRNLSFWSWISWSPFLLISHSLGNGGTSTSSGGEVPSASKRSITGTSGGTSWHFGKSSEIRLHQRPKCATVSASIDTNWMPQTTSMTGGVSYSGGARPVSGISSSRCSSVCARELRSQEAKGTYGSCISFGSRPCGSRLPRLMRCRHSSPDGATAQETGFSSYKKQGIMMQEDPPMVSA